jgi:sRNA-binding carbon storage regulator CsrA
MLVLTVKQGEKIVVWTKDGKMLEIEAVERRGDRTRLGFHCQDEIRVDRLPVYQSKQMEAAGRAA